MLSQKNCISQADTGMKSQVIRNSTTGAEEVRDFLDSIILLTNTLSQKNRSPWRWRSLLPGVVVAAVVLTGCQGLSTSPNPAAVSATLTAEVTSTKTPEQRRLEETVWVLQSINGEPALPDVEVTLEFAADTHIFRGYAGCNHYGGSYEISDHKLDIVEVEMSAQDCPQADIMVQESQYEDILWDITTYEIEDDMLTLKTDSSKMLVFMSRQ